MYGRTQVPGLNAPIPPGAQFGYQPGGWGKPPVDEEGNPLYGNVFGLADAALDDEPVRSRSGASGCECAFSSGGSGLANSTLDNEAVCRNRVCTLFGWLRPCQLHPGRRAGVEE